MAKFEGTQNIPSELLDLYRGTLNPHSTLSIVKKRYPFRMPRMQEGGSGVSEKQKAQRDRWKKSIALFKTLGYAERQRWYNAEPPWSSFLWYYNYFIMSALAGNADVPHGGAGVIKSIQVVKHSVPTTGGYSFPITTVDPNKTVVMMYGNSYISDKIQRGHTSVQDGSTVNIALSPSIDTAIAEVKLTGSAGYEDISEGTGQGIWGQVYVAGLTATQLTVGLTDIIGTYSYPFSWEIIEHKSQTIYPVITSIGASAIGIDWAKEPSVATDVSILVIEYI